MGWPGYRKASLVWTWISKAPRCEGGLERRLREIDHQGQKARIKMEEGCVMANDITYTHIRCYITHR